MLNINVFLAVFITGFTFSWDGWFHEQVGDEHVQGVIDMIVNLVYFLFFGVSIPWSSFNSLDFPLWKLFVCAILILIFRRLPAILAISRIMSPKLSFSEAVTVGWFGPVGVGAMWYEVLASTKLPENASFKIIIYFIVLCNVVVHGLVVPISKLSRGRERWRSLLISSSSLSLL